MPVGTGHMRVVQQKQAAHHDEDATIPSFTMTMAELKFADSLMPITRTVVTTNTMSTASS